jgi:predicted molibdopterin-dependent oxidoreductase YjgC
MTNAEGRVQRLFRALRSDAAGIRPDWRILSDLSGEMGEPLGYAAAAEVTHDLFADLPAYASIGKDAIPVEGVIAREDGGTLSQGEREFAPLPARGAARGAGEGSGDGGLILLTYSELLGDETTLLATPELMAMVSVPYVEVNGVDAQRLGLANGEWAEVRTDKGAVQRIVRINGRCPQGVCFCPDNLGQPRINEVLDWNVSQPMVQITAAPAPATVGAAAAEMAGAGD